MISKVNLSLKGASFQFEFEDKDDIECMHKAIAISDIRKECNVCKADREYFEMQTRKAKGFTFILIRCSKCGSQSGLGQYKDGGYFWKEFEQYTPKAGNMSERDVLETLK